MAFWILIYFDYYQSNFRTKIMINLIFWIQNIDLVLVELFSLGILLDLLLFSLILQVILIESCPEQNLFFFSYLYFKGFFFIHRYLWFQIFCIGECMLFLPYFLFCFCFYFYFYFYFYFIFIFIYFIFLFYPKPFIYIWISCLSLYLYFLVLFLLFVYFVKKKGRHDMD